MNELWYLLESTKDDDGDILGPPKFFSSKDKAIAYKNDLITEIKDGYESQHYYVEVHEYSHNVNITELTVYYAGSDDIKFEDHIEIGKAIPEE